MSIQKRIISGLTAAAVALTGAFTFSVSAGGGIPADWYVYNLENGKYPERETLPTYDGYTYSAKADGTVEITNFDITGTEITIPSRLGSMRVGSVSFPYKDSETISKIQKVNIPSDVLITRGDNLKYSEWYKNLPRTNGLVIVNDCVIGSDFGYASSGEYYDELDKMNFFTVSSDVDSLYIEDSNNNTVYFSSSREMSDNKLISGSAALKVGETYTVKIYKTYDKNGNGSNYIADSDSTAFTPTKEYSSYIVALKGSGEIDKDHGHINGTVVITEDKANPYDITIPDGVKMISNYALDSRMINKLNISGTVTSIGVCAFSRSSVKEVNIGSSVKEIQLSAFSDTEHLEKVNISSDTHIDNSAFRGSKWVEEQLETKKFIVVNGTLLGSKLSETGENNIPDSVTEPFQGSALTPSTYDYNTHITTWHYVDNVKLPAGVTEYAKNSMCYLCARNIEIPGTAVKLDDYSFVCLKGLRSLKLNEGTKIIGDYAFAVFVNDDDDNAKYFTSVTIPKSVTSIGKKAIGYAIMMDSSGNAYFGKIPNFTIKGYKGSAAEAYAKSNGFSFVPVGSAAVTTLGDLNGSGGKPNIDDLILMQKKVAGWNVDANIKSSADLDGNSRVDIDDLILMQKIVAGWDLNK